MARKKKPVPPAATPWHIELRYGLEPHEPGCAFIELGPRLYAEDAGADAYTYAELLEGYRWIAGVICRVAVVMGDDFDGCRRQGRVQCGGNEGVLDPRQEMEKGWGGPMLNITFPEAYLKVWLARVQDVLGQIVAADQWQPDAAAERRFWGESEPEPQVHHRQSAQPPLLDSQVVLDQERTQHHG